MLESKVRHFVDHRVATFEMERADVYLAPGPVFSVEGGSDAWLRIPYAKPEEELTQAVRRIAKAWSGGSHGAMARREARLLIA